uniref:Alternative protein IQSEC1 n=1 Tax=Homo sapiens TaxID=9606 RepID=L0R4Y9_HUMAN|nr:alternative protein IQSEC1 [Homo sapiens]
MPSTAAACTLRRHRPWMRRGPGTPNPRQPCTAWTTANWTR